MPFNISNDDGEDLTSTLNNLSIQSLYENAKVSASNTTGVDNLTTEHNILPKVKSKIIYFSTDNAESLEAKQAELQKKIMHNVYEEVDDNDQKVISVRWVLSQK